MGSVINMELCQPDNKLFKIKGGLMVRFVYTGTPNNKDGSNSKDKRKTLNKWVD